jgi:hypothetical protein
LFDVSPLKVMAGVVQAALQLFAQDQGQKAENTWPRMFSSR